MIKVKRALAIWHQDLKRQAEETRVLEDSSEMCPQLLFLLSEGMAPGGAASYEAPFHHCDQKITTLGTPAFCPATAGRATACQPAFQAPVMPHSRSPVCVYGKPRPQHMDLHTASPTQPQGSTFRLTEATPTRWGIQEGLSTPVFPAPLGSQEGAGLCLLTCSIPGKAPGKFSSPTLPAISSRLF